MRGGEDEKKMSLTFSVPVDIAAGGDEAAMQIDSGGMATLPGKVVRCDVQGCAEPRKYRLVRDWKRGACGIGHLRVLEVG
jgi:Ino eighty subunit 2